MFLHFKNEENDCETMQQKLLYFTGRKLSFRHIGEPETEGDRKWKSKPCPCLTPLDRIPIPTVQTVSLFGVFRSTQGGVSPLGIFCFAFFVFWKRRKRQLCLSRRHRKILASVAATSDRDRISLRTLCLVALTLALIKIFNSSCGSTPVI